LLDTRYFRRTILPTVTPSLLYDYLQCPHKVWRDVHGPKDEFVDEDNPFLKLLWERGVRHEERIIASFGFEYVDCSKGTEVERINRTNGALADRAPYIYQGVLDDGDLFGIPDLLHWDGSEYFPIEIKSGSAEEGAEDAPGKLKKHYAVQLALYCEILQRRGLQRSPRGAVIDITGQRFEYDLSLSQGPKTPETHWELYKRLHSEVVPLLLDEVRNEPANSAACKNCGWYHSCKKWCEEQDDLTQLFYVGRSVREAFKRDLSFSNVASLLTVNADDLAQRKKTDRAFLKGVGAPAISKMITRARLMREAGEPMIHEPLEFPDCPVELFFDIEADPTQDFVYLHGFWVRDCNGERFEKTVAVEITPEAERDAWARAIDLMQRSINDGAAIYYYSAYEKSTYRRLSRKYPDVIAEEEVNELFDHENVIDLYSDLVLKKTDWPLGSYGIKAIAQYLGFQWRDETPSGSLSIQWYNDFLSTGDEAYLNRVLEYNEDDCKATMIVKDYLKQRTGAM
jgi:predicted RecB family nuclease